MWAKCFVAYGITLGQSIMHCLVDAIWSLPTGFMRTIKITELQYCPFEVQRRLHVQYSTVPPALACRDLPTERTYGFHTILRTAIVSLNSMNKLIFSIRRRCFIFCGYWIYKYYSYELWVPYFKGLWKDLQTSPMTEYQHKHNFKQNAVSEIPRKNRNNLHGVEFLSIS
jgi:hypothetical protein